VAIALNAYDVDRLVAQGKVPHEAAADKDAEQLPNRLFAVPVEKNPQILYLVADVPRELDYFKETLGGFEEHINSFDKTRHHVTRYALRGYPLSPLPLYCETVVRNGLSGDVIKDPKDLLKKPRAIFPAASEFRPEHFERAGSYKESFAYRRLYRALKQAGMEAACYPAGLSA
jgi:hypothetical protein